jgi:hypothetical protein
MPPISPALIQWLQETINRLMQKSPAFFRKWQAVAAVLALAGYVPSVLSLFHIHTSAEFVSTMKSVGNFFLGMFLAAKLPIQGQQASMDQDGTIVKKIDEKVLPYTAAKEIKEAEKPGGVLNDNTEKVTETIVRPIRDK